MKKSSNLTNKELRVRIKEAQVFIDEHGGLSQTAKLLNLKPSSVWSWKQGGIPEVRRDSLKLNFPDSKAWKLS